MEMLIDLLEYILLFTFGKPKICKVRNEQNFVGGNFLENFVVFFGEIKTQL